MPESDDPLQIFIDLFPDDAEAQSSGEDIANLPLEERLQKHIIDGEKQHLIETLEEALKKYSPLEVINDHLLTGMKVVGELFGSGRMQLPFVLQSAEVMKMAVSHLEPYMEKIEGRSKGAIVLATVKGDVHDIGKNLVDIILTNNGYTVYNLGIKQPIGTILQAFRENGADAIGLSGLLVKSVNVMEENLKEMVDQKINVPVLLGGAALSRHYCESYLRDVYAASGGNIYHGRDAFEGLRIMDLLKSDRLNELDGQIEERLAKRADVEKKIEASKKKSGTVEAQASSGGAGSTSQARSGVAADLDVPSPPFWGDRVVESLSLDQVYPFINKVALYRGQWMFKKGRMSEDQYAALLADEVEPLFARLCRQCRDENILRPGLVYGYFPCNSEGCDLMIYDPQDPSREIERFCWPRQKGEKRLCVADYFRGVGSGVRDVIGMSCVTMGQEVSRVARELFDADNYSEYLFMHGMGVECAESLAELWHKTMRRELGIGGDDAPDVKALFTQGYRGSRYSFGYPAVPDLSDQEKLFRLLKPERVGCVLTENWQIEPEQSTSAIIVHHPEAKYFSV